MTKIRSVAVVAATSVMVLGLSVAQAASVIQPASITTNMGNALDPTVMIDQSGLTTPFISGVTDFDSYLAGDSTHNSRFTSTRWRSSSTTSGNIDMFLGGPHIVQSLAFWGVSFNSATSVRVFNLLVDGESTFSNPTTLVTSGLVDASGNSHVVGAQRYDFAPTLASYVRFQVVSLNNGGVGAQPGADIGEFAFNAAPIPEPATFGMLGLGALVVSVLAKRRARGDAA